MVGQGFTVTSAGTPGITLSLQPSVRLVVKKLFVVLILLLVFSSFQTPTIPLWRVRTYGKVVWAVPGERFVAATVLRDIRELELHLYSLNGELLTKWDVDLYFQLVHVTSQSLVGYVWTMSSMETLVYSTKGIILSQTLVEMAHTPSGICITPGGYFATPYHPDTPWADCGLVFFNPGGKELRDFSFQYGEKKTDLFYRDGYYFCETNLDEYVFTPNGKLVPNPDLDSARSSSYLLVEDETFLLYFNN